MQDIAGQLPKLETLVILNTVPGAGDSPVSLKSGRVFGDREFHLRQRPAGDEYYFAFTHTLSAELNSTPAISVVSWTYLGWDFSPGMAWNSRMY